MTVTSAGAARQAAIPPTLLAGVLDVASRDGRSVLPWFSGTGLDPAMVRVSGTRVSLEQSLTVLRRALAEAPRRALGIELGQRDTLLSFGLLGVAMRASGTVGEALDLVLELHRAAGCLLDVEREEHDGHLAIRFHERLPEPELVAFLCEEAIVSTVAMIRSMLGESSWSPTRVELAYPSPGHAARYHRVLRCPLDFRAGANRVVIPAELVRRPLPTRHEPTRAAAVEACRALLGPGDAPPDLVASLEALMSRHLRRPLGMRDVAERLHVTERTLHRQLAACGVRFRDVADRVREDRATALLCRTSMPIGEVAAEVGFRDGREFRRAYVRWTGRTPSQARAGSR